MSVCESTNHGLEMGQRTQALKAILEEEAMLVVGMRACPYGMPYGILGRGRARVGGGSARSPPVLTMQSREAPSAASATPQARPCNGRPRSRVRGGPNPKETPRARWR